MTDDLLLRNRGTIAVITGGTQGLGLAIAKRLATEGAHGITISGTNARGPFLMMQGVVRHLVKTGQSGCQIAEDLHLAGRCVHLWVGGALKSLEISGALWLVKFPG
jgi:hypothetical protein